MSNFIETRDCVYICVCSLDGVYYWMLCVCVCVVQAQLKESHLSADESARARAEQAARLKDMGRRSEHWSRISIKLRRWAAYITTAIRVLMCL